VAHPLNRTPSKKRGQGMTAPSSNLHAATCTSNRVIESDWQLKTILRHAENHFLMKITLEHIRCHIE
jgi:hypothetical protein